MMDLYVDRLELKTQPALNVARFNHSSMVLRSQVYVACGQGNEGRLSSVEMLMRGAKKWVLIEIPDLEPR